MFVFYVQPEGCGYRRWNSPRLPPYVEDLISQLRHVRDLKEFDQRALQQSLDFLRDTGKELEETVQRQEVAIANQAKEIGELKVVNRNLEAKLKMYEYLIVGVRLLSPLFLAV